MDNLSNNTEVNSKLTSIDTTTGAKADAPATTGTTDPWSSIALLKGVYNKLGAVIIAAGTNLIGKVGIDQVTANANEVVTKTGSITTATLATETTKVIGTVNDKIADGDDISLGAKADAAQPDSTQTASLIAITKGLLATANLIKGTDGIKKITDTVTVSGAVTTSGTVTATLATETTKVIGTVNDKIADGDDITQGTKADAAATVGDTTPFSTIAMLKGIYNKLGAVVVAAGSNLIGKVSIDQSTANANEVVTKTGSITTATLATETTKVIGTVNDKIADGDAVTTGAKADAPATTGTTDPWSVVSLLKGVYNKLGAVVIAAGSSLIGAVKIHGQKDTDGTIGEAVSYVLDPNTRPVMGIVDRAPWNPPMTTVTLYHLALTTLNTEYSQLLPVNCRYVSVYILDGVSTDTFRIAYATGKVATPTAPYHKFAQNIMYETANVNVNIAAGTLYIASSASTKTAVIEAWA